MSDPGGVSSGGAWGGAAADDEKLWSFDVLTVFAQLCHKLKEVKRPQVASDMKVRVDECKWMKVECAFRRECPTPTMSLDPSDWYANAWLILVPPLQWDWPRLSFVVMNISMQVEIVGNSGHFVFLEQVSGRGRERVAGSFQVLARVFFLIPIGLPTTITDCAAPPARSYPTARAFQPRCHWCLCILHRGSWRKACIG